MKIKRDFSIKEVAEEVYLKPIAKLLGRRNQTVKDIWQIITKTQIISKYRKEILLKHAIPKGLTPANDFYTYVIDRGDTDLTDETSRWLESYTQLSDFEHDVRDIVRELNLPTSAVRPLTYYFLYGKLPKGYVSFYDYLDVAYTLLSDGVMFDSGLGYTKRELHVIKDHCIYLIDKFQNKVTLTDIDMLIETYAKNNKRKSAPLTDIKTDIKIIRNLEKYKTSVTDDTGKFIWKSSTLADLIYPEKKIPSVKIASQRLRKQINRLIKKFPILTR